MVWDIAEGIVLAVIGLCALYVVLVVGGAAIFGIIGALDEAIMGSAKPFTPEPPRDNTSAEKVAGVLFVSAIAATALIFVAMCFSH
jgi:hypothetical protein